VLLPVLEPIAEAFAEDRSVAAFKSTSLCVGSKVFVMFAAGRLVLKLPASRCAQLAAEGVGAPHDPGNGRLMKEWLSVAPGQEARWLELARESRAFVGAGPR
jgi:hypothetical protein